MIIVAPVVLEDADPLCLTATHDNDEKWRGMLAQRRTKAFNNAISLNGQLTDENGLLTFGVNVKIRKPS